MLSHDELELARRACTPRQRELLTYYARGYPVRVVAGALHLDPSTVRAGIRAGLRNLARARALEGEP